MVRQRVELEVVQYQSFINCFQESSGRASAGFEKIGGIYEELVGGSHFHADGDCGAVRSRAEHWCGTPT
jgi:hypothetical protein